MTRHARDAACSGCGMLGTLRHARDPSGFGVVRPRPRRAIMSRGRNTPRPSARSRRVSTSRRRGWRQDDAACSGCGMFGTLHHARDVSTCSGDPAGSVLSRRAIMSRGQDMPRLSTRSRRVSTSRRRGWRQDQGRGPLRDQGPSTSSGNQGPFDKLREPGALRQAQGTRALRQAQGTRALRQAQGPRGPGSGGHRLRIHRLLRGLDLLHALGRGGDLRRHPREDEAVERQHSQPVQPSAESAREEDRPLLVPRA
ncbi:hypothetical protein RS83_00492 [Microbacterium oxydans]|uniref:Uncharacterized protein n=1 Tax=Microbacterium oxydans TaxID=82380 RepID=A0A0F0LHL2_9MICO|nr:hypothetical protein RS83_00492 [Microbacterium oxydans]